jgi:phage baseplate assembly protein W
MAIGKTHGIKFPFRDSQTGTYVSLTQNSDEEIRTNLIHLVLTRKGSRYFLPDFGTRIYEFIFEPLDTPTFDAIRTDITNAVEKYIPNLIVNDISVTPYQSDDSIRGEINTEILGGELYRIPDRSTEEYTAKVRIDYTITDSAFNSRDFVIINI